MLSHMFFVHPELTAFDDACHLADQRHFPHAGKALFFAEGAEEALVLERWQRGRVFFALNVFFQHHGDLVTLNLGCLGARRNDRARTVAYDVNVCMGRNLVILI